MAVFVRVPGWDGFIVTKRYFYKEGVGLSTANAFRPDIGSSGYSADWLYRRVLEAKEGAPLGSQAAHHKCANTKCVNPDHLQPVTHWENTAEMLARKSLVSRVRELEAELARLDPGNDLLDRVPVI